MADRQPTGSRPNCPISRVAWAVGGNWDQSGCYVLEVAEAARCLQQAMGPIVGEQRFDLFLVVLLRMRVRNQEFLASLG